MLKSTLPVIEAPQPTHVADAERICDVLKGVVSGEVRFDRIARALYSTDASVYQITPLGVVIPRTSQDIIDTIRICGQFRVPITPRGGGTSQAGQAIGAGIQLDCSKYFNQVLAINAKERWALVQPGCVLDDLNRAVRPHGLQFAPDISTASRATIGGMIANNSSGTRSVVFGKTGDHVLELRVALADGVAICVRPMAADEWNSKCAQTDCEGQCYATLQRLVRENASEIERRYPKILRRVGGYNLQDHYDPAAARFSLIPLLVGSEGTLAITLEAKLGLVPLPKARSVLVVQFHDLLEALAATPAILQHKPSAVEVLDKYILDSTHLNAEASRLREFLHGDPRAILIIECSDDDPAHVAMRIQSLYDELRRAGIGTYYHHAPDASAQNRIWKLRQAALGLSMAQKGDAKAISFVEDTAVAPERLRDYIAEFLALVERHGTRAGVYAHASVGCLHVRPVINLKTVAGITQFQRIAEETAELVLKYGGSLSGEHGDGLVRSSFQEKMFGPDLYRAFREIKKAFDPLNILNPGKIVDAPPLAANLRFGPAYVTPTVRTTFDFTADGGIARAAELCAGVGECRKRRDGTMCPSFRATRDEQHSTRGRANSLRLALTGQLGLTGLTDPALFDVLDLCLECKACKSECPTNVDVARLKAEFLHQYYRKHGLPLRQRLFGNVSTVSRWGSRLAPISNWLMESHIWRWLNERLLQIDRRRSPPPFSARDFAAMCTSRGRSFPHGGSPRVHWLVDTFTNYHEPHLGVALLQLLERLQCAVHIDLPHAKGRNGWTCCGRPLISNGMLTQARAIAQRNVAHLYSTAVDGNTIVALEPSCLLTIRDDYPALVSQRWQTRAAVVAAACRTIDEFLETELRTRAVKAAPASQNRILLHTHCHQRSLVGVQPTLRLLESIGGVKVSDIDAGCCGLAGSFGYEQEHYEISRLVGEEQLFPVLRSAPTDAMVVASGFSCRLQIGHFTGKRAVHLVELLNTLLDESSELQ